MYLMDHGIVACALKERENLEVLSYPIFSLTCQVKHVTMYFLMLTSCVIIGTEVIMLFSLRSRSEAVIFALSLLDNVRRPILVIAATGSLSEWEVEFSKRSRFINVVTYKGSEYVRAAIRNLEFYDENESITFQVPLSSPNVIVEDMEMLDHIKLLSGN